MDKFKLSNLIACGLLLVAIAHLPYNFYRFLRISITIISGMNAYVAFKGEYKGLFIGFLIITILFNPIIPIYLDKTTWIPIDLAAGLFFAVTLFFKTTNDKEIFDKNFSSTNENFK